MEESQNSHETYIRLLLRHEPMVRAAIRAVVHRAEDVDEVMQAVSLVAWRKFDSLTDHEGFGRWACVIARYEVLKFLRSRARDRFLLDESLVERILAESVDEDVLRRRRLSLLERCLEKLPENRRELLLQVYSPGCTTRAVAERLGKSEDSLYQLLRRLRLDLKRCVEQELAEEGGSKP
jgi:RNA polymerase sigma-70 factor (ECF subfamily)